MKKNTSSNLTSSDKSFTSTGLEKQESSSPSDSITFTVSKEKLDEIKNSKQDTLQHEPVPTGLKTLSVLSMIGSGFFILIIFGLILRSTYSAILAFVYLVFLVPYIYKFLGALEMYKGKKRGFKMYIIPTIIMTILYIGSVIGGYQDSQLGFAIFTIFSSIVFALIFYSYKDRLK
jgi:hypothetical protein